MISHTSVRRYKDRKKGVPEIGRELQADAVLEGTVQLTAGSVHVTAQLINTRTDKPIWSGRYDRAFRDVLTLQSIIARAIVTGIRIRVTPRELSQLARTRAVRPDALEAYLRGRYVVELGATRGLDQRSEYLREAVTLDPEFALAWAVLAQTEASVLQRDDAPLNESVLNAARKAMQLDGSLAETHVVAGDIELFWNWNWVKAEAEYERAIRLNPGSLDAQVHYALCMMYLGNADIGLKHWERAQALDPLSPIVNSAFGMWMHLAGQSERALRQLQHSIEIDPTYPANYTFLSRIYEDLNRTQMEVDARQNAARLNGQSADFIQGMRTAFASGGLRDFKRRAVAERLRRLAERARHVRVSPMEFAAAYTELGDKAQALDWLEKAYQERSPRLPALKVAREWTSLRAEPRFQSLLARMRL